MMKQKRFFLLVLLFFFWFYCLYLVFQSTSTKDPSILPSKESVSKTLLLEESKKTTGTLAIDEASEKTEAIPNESCHSCHAEVYQEWQSSFHAKAWSNPDFQTHLNLYRAADCLPCHIPEPLLLRKEASIQARNKEMNCGISCLTCHLAPQGIASVRESLGNSAHPVIKISDLEEDRLCVECHQSIGKTFLQFKQPAQTCRGCHMPEVTRVSQKKGFSHRLLDREHPQFMKSALNMELEQTSDTFSVFISNPNIPHNIPGERHFRILLLFVDIWTKEQSYPLVSYREVLKDISMFRKETLQDKIQPGQKISYRYFKQSGSYARIRLVYKRFPGELDSEGLELNQLTLEFTS